MEESVVKKRYFVELAYKGTAFHGWQIQPNAITVQELLNKALSTILSESIATVGCGRTDTGVHASNFFAHFDTDITITDNEICEGKIPHNRLLKATNALVGYDIAIKRFIAVNDGAHARFDAVSRSYNYFISRGKNPFHRDFSLLVEHPLDIDLMNQSAKLIMQHKDFGCFCKANSQNITNICNITYAQWREEGGQLIFTITADRFLRNMVRAIVGTLLGVGRGELNLTDIQNILDSQQRSNAGESVSAAGLFLTEIKYPERIFTKQ